MGMSAARAWEGALLCCSYSGGCPHPLSSSILCFQLFAPGVEHRENPLVQPHTCAPSSFRRVTGILLGVGFVISALELFLLICQRTCQTEEIQLFLFSLFQTNLRDDVDNVFPVHVVK